MVFGIELKIQEVITPIASNSKGCDVGCRYCSTKDSSRWYCGDICRSCRRSVLNFKTRIKSVEFFVPTNTCKTCNTQSSKSWTKDKTQCQKCYTKSYRQLHAEHITRRAQEYRKLHIEEIRARKNKHRQLTGSHRIDQKLRKNRKRTATLPWVDRSELKSVYQNCPKDMTVDHIIPLKNDFVCGLEVPWNLQYLSMSDNARKWNRFDGTYENDSWRNK